MGVLEIILGALVALLGGLNIFQLINGRAVKKQYKAEAEKAEAEAKAEKQSALEKRLESMEHLYEEQGKTVDELRKDVLRLSDEKFANEQRIQKLENENKELRTTVEHLKNEVEAYKTIINKK